MGFLRAGNAGTQITKYSGLQVQTTSSSVPVPISYGANILAPNCFWYQKTSRPIRSLRGAKAGARAGAGGLPQATPIRARS